MLRLAGALARIFAAALLVLGTDAAAITFDDGLVHVIDPSNSFPLECVIVDDGPLGQTTSLEVLPGAEIGTVICGVLFARGVSEIDLAGGTIPQVTAQENSHVLYSSGDIATFYANDNSVVSVIDGRGRLFSSGTAHIDVFGGTFISTSTFGEESVVNIRGGDFVRVDGVQSADLNIFGGAFSQGVQSINSPRIDIAGGEINGLVYAGDTAAITFFGSEFNFPFGEVTAISGTLTGTLADGTPLRIDFSRASTATIDLAPSKESSRNPNIPAGLI